MISVLLRSSAALPVIAILVIADISASSSTFFGLLAAGAMYEPKSVNNGVYFRTYNYSRKCFFEGLLSSAMKNVKN